MNKTLRKIRKIYINQIRPDPGFGRLRGEEGLQTALLYQRSDKVERDLCHRYHICDSTDFALPTVNRGISYSIYTCLLNKTSAPLIYEII